MQHWARQARLLPVVQQQQLLWRLERHQLVQLLRLLAELLPQMQHWPPLVVELWLLAEEELLWGRRS
ncbi:Uncharacterised protein [uncultured Blautia sp.]|nr:Uncharacterised protein [uncultured Blautia sp.]